MTRKDRGSITIPIKSTGGELSIKCFQEIGGELADAYIWVTKSDPKDDDIGRTHIITAEILIGILDCANDYKHILHNTGYQTKRVIDKLKDTLRETQMILKTDIEDLEKRLAKTEEIRRIIKEDVPDRYEK